MTLPETLAVDEPALARVEVEQRERMCARRRDRWRLRALVSAMGDSGRRRLGSWDDVPFARVAGCGRVVHGDTVDVRSKDGQAYLSGVATCSSVWACAVCEAKIRTGRAVELRELAAAHAAAGGIVSMMTLTVRHHRGQSLGELMAAQSDAYRSLQQDARWRAMRSSFGLVGQVRSWEVTQGFTVDPVTGSWHPHFHVLLLWDWDCAEFVAGEMAWVSEAWAERIESRLGLRPNDHGFDHRVIPTEDVEYVSKISDEITRADLKGGSRSVWALVEYAVEGNSWAVARWLEYFEATKGKRAIQYSRGLRARYELADEATDDELAQADRDGDLEVRWSKQEYSYLSRCGWGQVPRVVDALEGIERRIAHNRRSPELACSSP